MAKLVDELTIEYHEGDEMKVRELDRVVLTKGAWATVIFRYQELDRKINNFGADKYTIRRYQKRNGEYNQCSKFNISSKAQAKKMIAVLNKWIDE